MTNSKIDSRQTKNRAGLDTITGGQPNTTLDQQLLSINAALSTPFRLAKRASSRYIDVQSNVITNTVTNHNTTVRPISNNQAPFISKLPEFQSGWIYIPTVHTDPITVSNGTALYINDSAPFNHFLKILIQINAVGSGAIVLSAGSWASTINTTTFPSITKDAYIVGYFILATDGVGNISDVTDNYIYQFNGADIVDQEYALNVKIDTSNFANLFTNTTAFDTVQKCLDYVDDNVVMKSTAATDNAIARFDTASGQKIQNSLATVDDDGSINSIGIKITEVISDPASSPNQMILFAKNLTQGHRAFLKDPNGNVIPLGVGSIPIGGVIAIMPHLVGTYNCTATITADSNGFVQCNGQTINDPTSPMHGVNIPNINNDVFLMGRTVSGNTGGSNSLATHDHHIPAMATSSDGAATTCTSNGSITGTQAFTNLGCGGTVSSSVTVSGSLGGSTGDAGNHDHTWLSFDLLGNLAYYNISTLVYDPETLGETRAPFLTGYTFQTSPNIPPPVNNGHRYIFWQNFAKPFGDSGNPSFEYKTYSDGIHSHSASVSGSMSGSFSTGITGGYTGGFTVNFANAAISTPPTYTVNAHAHSIAVNAHDTVGIVTAADSRPSYISTKYIMRIK